jgi:hypothetical protein
MQQLTLQNSETHVQDVMEAHDKKVVDAKLYNMDPSGAGRSV